jgi:hypothetical protein
MLTKQEKLVTREELYAQVWQTPMIKLAKQYGISDNGLRKICDKLDVPYPARGYWAKKAAGYKVLTYKLPPQKNTTPSGTYIRPTPEQETVTQEVKEAVAAELAKNSKIPVPEKLVKPHPIIAKWLRDQEERLRYYRRHNDPYTRNLLKTAEFTDMDKRIHRILQGLFKALESKQGKVKEAERGELLVEFKGEEIEFGLREKLKQVHRPLTEDEKRWSFNRDKTTKYDLTPTGILVFSIKTYIPGKLKREWIESVEYPMESQLADIVATILASVPLLAEKTKQRKEEEEKRQLESRRRYEEEQSKKLENYRWRRFMEMATQWRDTQIAGNFIAALKNMPTDETRKFGDKDMAEWINWAEEQLVSRNPLNNGTEEVWDSVSKVNTWTYSDR